MVVECEIVKALSYRGPSKSVLSVVNVLHESMDPPSWLKDELNAKIKLMSRSHQTGQKPVNRFHGILPPWSFFIGSEGGFAHFKQKLAVLM